MDLSSELRKIQQEKHKKSLENNINNQPTTNDSKQDTLSKLEPPKMDYKQPSISSSTTVTDINNESMEMDQDIKDNDNNNDENENKIDWDKEIAAQLQQQYNHIDNEFDNSSNIDGSVNNDDNNDEQKSPNNINIINNNRFGIFNMFGDNDENGNGIQSMFEQFINNGSSSMNGNNNGNGNGHYSFSFQSSNMGPNGYTMSFSSNNNGDNININENNDNIPPNIAQMFNQMNQGMFMHNGNELREFLSNMHGINNDNIQNMSYEELLEHFPIIQRGLNENEINNNSIVDNYKKINKDIKKENKNIKSDKLKELNKEQNENCSICLESFNENDQIRRLPCLHIFHKNEIDQWLKTKDACPICRQSIKQNN